MIWVAIWVASWVAQHHQPALVPTYLYHYFGLDDLSVWVAVALVHKVI